MQYGTTKEGNHLFILNTFEDKQLVVWNGYAKPIGEFDLWLWRNRERVTGHHVGTSAYYNVTITDAKTAVDFKLRFG